MDPEGERGYRPPWKITSGYMFPWKFWYGLPREAIGIQ